MGHALLQLKSLQTKLTWGYRRKENQENCGEMLHIGSNARFIFDGKIKDSCS